MKVTIKTKSYTIIGSGEAKSIIDSDIIFDSLGIPYIPSRRIKGLLRKSAQEICDIMGKDYSIVDNIFGTGEQEGKICFDNFYIKNYEKIKKALESYKEKPPISKEEVVEYFTELRKRTSIDENGIAKEGSLRVYRVLKPEIEFEGEVDTYELTNEEREILIYAFKNLRRIGMQRNRGYGKVEIRIEQQEKKETKSSVDFKVPAHTEFVRLPFILETLSPVVIASHAGGVNSIETYKYIPSTTLRGAFIKAFNTLTEKFINGELIITPAYPYVNEKEFYPAPLILQKDVYKEEGDLISLHEAKEREGKYKHLKDKFVYFTESDYFSYSPNTITYFHSTVKNPLKGHSEEGDIFNYEAIEIGETFKGYIIGKKEAIEESLKFVSEEIDVRIGRSKKVQYGKVKVKFLACESLQCSTATKEFYIVFQSPAIFYNELGLCVVSHEVIKKYLEDFLECKVEIKENYSVLASTYVEGFVNEWKCKNNRELAVKEGSTLYVKLETDSKNLHKKFELLEIYGIGERTIHGFGRVKIFEDLDKKYRYQKIEKRKVFGKTNNEELKILKSILYRKLERIIKNEAIKKAKEQRNSIPKTLLQRLKEVIQKCAQDLTPLHEWLNQIMGKRAHENLQKANLFYSKEWINKHFTSETEKVLKKYYKEKLYNKEEIFNLSKNYWITYLDALRTLLKKEKENEQV